MTLEKTLKAIIIVGLFTIPFLVLILADSMFFPYVVGKNFAFRAIVEIIFVAWGLLVLINSEYRPRKSIIFICTLIFIFVVALANIFGANPYKSLWSNFERMEGFITLLHLFAYTVLWGTMLNTEKLRILFWRISLGVSVIISVHALVEFFTTEQGRLSATLGNPIYLAVYALFHIFIAAIFALRHNAKFAERLILGNIILLELIVLYLTATRGATLGLIGGMFIAAIGIAFTERENLKLKKLAIGAIFVVIILVSGFFALRDTTFVQNSPVLNRFAHISLTKGTVMARTYVWGIALQGVKERPILGWGQGNFNYVFNKYYDPRMHAQEPWFDRTHNIVFDWLIAAGVLGLLSYIAIFITLLVSFYKTTHWHTSQKWLMLGLLVAYSFHNLTVFDNIVSYILFFSIIAWVYAMSSDTSESKNKNLIPEFSFNNPITKFLAILTTGTIAFVFVWSVNADAYRANKTLLFVLTNMANAEKLGKNPETIDKAITRAEMALQSFQKAESYDSYANQEVREYFTKRSISILRQEWMPQELRQAYFSQAVESIQKQKSDMPNDPRLPLVLANLYQTVGMFEQEGIELNIARELSQNKQTIILAQGVNALNLSDKERALSLFKEAYELDRTNELAEEFYLKLQTEMNEEQQ